MRKEGKMATIINNPDSSDTGNNSGTNILIAVVLLIVFFLVMIFYGLPYLRGGSRSETPTENIQNNVNEETPANETEINIPDQIDVNVDDETGAVEENMDGQ